LPGSRLSAERETQVRTNLAYLVLTLGLLTLGWSLRSRFESPFLAFDCYWQDERYELLAIDSLEQMNLAFDNGDGTGTELVGPTVFAIGHNEKYIVLKQHPRPRSVGSTDRRKTNFFVVERTLSSSIVERQRRIRGPLEQKSFDALSASMRLPPFTKTFAELE